VNNLNIYYTVWESKRICELSSDVKDLNSRDRSDFFASNNAVNSSNTPCVSSGLTIHNVQHWCLVA
jgi:hypothetical protein